MKNRRFLQDRSGNVALTTALVAIILFTIGGASVDFIRFTTLRGELQAATDSAVLAAASLSNKNSPTVVAADYFDANFDRERFDLDASDVDFDPVVVADTQTLRTIQATATATMETYFIGIIGFLGAGGFDTLDAIAMSQASETSQNVEIAMVLDISISMQGQKINSLIDAASNFVTTVYEDSRPNQTSVNVIPFSRNVNVEPIFEDFADPGTFTSPAVKPCVLYDHFGSDYNEGTLGILSAVDQDPALQSGREACVSTPVFLNSEDEGAIRNAISGFSAGGRTDLHIGTAWGLKALSPDWRGDLGGDFNDRPAEYGDETIKALIVMSDGRVNPIPDASGVEDVPLAEQQIRDMCDDARDNNIVVYTIGFQITDGSAADLLLEDCASSLSQYFFVETIDLEAAFQGIAASISKLRVTQ